MIWPEISLEGKSLMKFSRVMTAVAAVAMVATPVVAQAGTRASSGAGYAVTGYEGSRAVAPVSNQQELKRKGTLLALLLASGAAIAGLAIAIGNQSNGAN